MESAKFKLKCDTCLETDHSWTTADVLSTFLKVLSYYKLNCFYFLYTILNNDEKVTIIQTVKFWIVLFVFFFSEWSINLACQVNFSYWFFYSFLLNCPIVFVWYRSIILRYFGNLRHWKKECFFTDSATNYLLSVRTVRLKSRVDLAVRSMYLISTGRVDKVRITNYTSMVSNGLITTTTTLRI